MFEINTRRENRKPCETLPPIYKISMSVEGMTDIVSTIKRKSCLDKDVRSKLEELERRIVSIERTLADISGLSEESRRLKEADKERHDRFVSRLDKAVADCKDGDRISIDYLTDYMAMSRSTLYRKVKAHTGMSANEYVRRKRIELAKEFLLQGVLSLDEIAFRVGFNSISHFRQTFKSFYGTGPADYLKKLRNC